mgnify:CR=1 FL=1
MPKPYSAQHCPRAHDESLRQSKGVEVVQVLQVVAAAVPLVHVNPYVTLAPSHGARESPAHRSLDTEPVLRSVCKFFELPWQDDLLTYHERSADRLQEMARPLPSDGRAKELSVDDA